ncbi:MAG: hypothetical protein KDA75_21030, partial [Planctomycetaceae bacterium]|nr:hypothetical protein [Planctomycetaceae bacterium]
SNPPPELQLAWQSLLREILAAGSSDEELVECLSVPVSFVRSAEAESVLERAGLGYTYPEMKKVFFTEEPNQFGHSYRRFWKGPLGRDDLSDIKELLSGQPSTKRAVLTLVDTAGKKVPCVNVLQFLIRDERLETVYFARAQDAYRKFCADALCICDLAHQVAESLSLEIGPILGTIGSAHIYLEDLPKAREVAEADYFR